MEAFLPLLASPLLSSPLLLLLLPGFHLKWRLAATAAQNQHATLLTPASLPAHLVRMSCNGRPYLTSLHHFSSLPPSSKENGEGGGLVGVLYGNVRTKVHYAHITKSGWGQDRQGTYFCLTFCAYIHYLHEYLLNLYQCRNILADLSFTRPISKGTY